MDSIARRPWRLVVLGVAALAGLFYSLSGYAIAGSFTISNPEQLNHWQRVALVYLACAGISTLAALGRHGRPLPTRPPRATLQSAIRVTHVEPDERSEHPDVRQHPVP